MCFPSISREVFRSCWSVGFAENWKAALGRLRLTVDGNGILQDERGKAKGFLEIYSVSWKLMATLKVGFFLVCVCYVYVKHTDLRGKEAFWNGGYSACSSLEVYLVFLAVLILASICFSSDFCNVNTFVKPLTHFMLSSINYQMSQSDVILSGEKLKAFPLRWGTRQGYPLLPAFIQHGFGSPGWEQLGKKKKFKAFKSERRQTVSICRWHTIYRKPQRLLSKKLSELIDESSKIAG